MTYKTGLVVFVAAAAMALVGCGDDDESDGGTGGSSGAAGSGGSGGGTGGSGTGGSGGSSGAGTGGSSGAGTGGSGMGGSGMGGSGMGGSGMGGSGGGTTAEAFCSEYESVCSYGGTDRFTDEMDCIAQYNGFVTARQECVVMHLGLAETMGVDMHCPHATGVAICTMM